MANKKNQSWAAAVLCFLKQHTVTPANYVQEKHEYYDIKIWNLFSIVPLGNIM